MTLKFDTANQTFFKFDLRQLNTQQGGFLKIDMRHESTLRAIPIRRLWCDQWYNRRYNRLMTANCTADRTADHPVGMAYLLGNLATHCWATTLARRRETADLYQVCLIFQPRLVVRQPIGDQSAWLSIV